MEQPEPLPSVESSAASESETERRYLKWALVVLFWLVHFSFYYSALQTGHMRHLYPQGEIQHEHKMDFTQVPNGAKTFFEGGHTLGTVERPYPVLYNVYHPLMTVVVGGVLQSFDNETAFLYYTLFKLVVTVFLFLVVGYYYGRSQHFVFAAFVFLCFCGQSVELGCGQYHFLLNCCVALVLWGAIHQWKEVHGTCWTAASLFIKPISVLWIPLLLIRRNWMMAILPPVIFGLLTALHHIVTGDSLFYLVNLRRQLSSGEVPPYLPRYCVMGIVAFVGAGPLIGQAIKLACAVAMLCATYLLRKNLFVGLFIWVSYFLLFFTLVFEYHYTSLIPFFVLGVLTQRVFQTPLAKTLMFLCCLPSAFLPLKLLGMFPYQPGRWERDVPGGEVDPQQMLSDTGMFVLMCFRVLPLLVLVIYVIASSIKLDAADSAGESASSDEAPDARLSAN